MHIKRYITAIPGLVAIASAGYVHAQTAGSVYLSTGWFHVAPQDSSSELRTTNVNGTPVNIVANGSGAGIKDADTWGLALGYFATDHLAIEGVFGIPPTHTLYGKGTLASAGSLGEAKQWSPTLLFKYYFRDANARFRPNIGLGVARIWYTGAEITNQAFANSVLHGQTTVDVGSSWAPVFNAGIHYNFSKNWFAAASLSYLVFSTDATLHTAAQTPGGTVAVTSTAHLRVNPIVSYISVGYRF